MRSSIIRVQEVSAWLSTARRGSISGDDLRAVLNAMERIDQMPVPLLVVFFDRLEAARLTTRPPHGRLVKACPAKREGQYHVKFTSSSSLELPHDNPELRG